MFETVLMPILTLLVGGGLATFITVKATRRTANANADQAEVQARTEEFHLLKEQIELNQQQNLDLTTLNLKLAEQLKDAEARYVEQTELLRQTQKNLAQANEVIIKLTAENGELRVELAKKKCEDTSCPFRQPPNATTPPRPDMTRDEYHMAATKKTKKDTKKTIIKKITDSGN